MTSGLFGSLVVVSAALSVTGCTFLVTFDDRADASCLDGVCDGSVDATRFFDGGDVSFDDDALPSIDSDTPLDAGDCSVLSEGEPCAKASECSGVWKCHKGECTPDPVEAGTPCGSPPPDGGCQLQAVCKGAVCASPTDVDASCGMAPDDCHEAPMCTNGTCGAAVALKDGTNCGPTPDVCHVSATCTGGVCGSQTNAANTKSCASAPDGCHDAPKCSNGTCGAAPEKANGTPWGSGGIDMCCGGKEVTADTNGDCGVCGWACVSGQQCNLVDGYYFCTGCNVTNCPSGCCSLTGTSHCSPSDCTTGDCKSPTTCTDGSHCVAGTVDRCEY